jgi:Cu+-exporting ATPase
LISGIYFGVTSWASDPKYALQQLWRDRYIITPLLLGFGIQVALYIILKKRLFVPATTTGPSGAVTGVSGTTSTVAMIACCAHRVADVLPILGLTVAATFLAKYRTTFIYVGMASNLIGIGVILFVLLKERRKAITLMQPSMENL